MLLEYSIENCQTAMMQIIVNINRCIFISYLFASICNKIKGETLLVEVYMVHLCVTHSNIDPISNNINLLATSSKLRGDRERERSPNKSIRISCDLKEKALDSRSKVLDFDFHSQCQSCVEMSDKLFILYYLCMLSSNGYLV